MELDLVRLGEEDVEALAHVGRGAGTRSRSASGRQGRQTDRDIWAVDLGRQVGRRLHELEGWRDHLLGRAKEQGWVVGVDATSRRLSTDDETGEVSRRPSSRRHHGNEKGRHIGRQSCQYSHTRPLPRRRSGFDPIARQAPEAVGERRPLRPVGAVLGPQALDDRHIVRVVVPDEDVARARAAVGRRQKGETERLEEVKPDAARRREGGRRGQVRDDCRSTLL